MRPTSSLPMQAIPDGKNAEIAFYIEPLESWRCWAVDLHDHRGVLLRSITYKMAWLRRKPSRAHCLRQLGVSRGYEVHAQPHGCPSIDHGCGLYSVKQHRMAKQWAWHGTSDLRVIGEVKIWGRVLKYSDGYISEYAYPKRLYITQDFNSIPEMRRPQAEPSEVAELLEEAYGVDVEIGWPE